MPNWPQPPHFMKCDWVHCGWLDQPALTEQHCPTVPMLTCLQYKNLPNKEESPKSSYPCWRWYCELKLEGPQPSSCCASRSWTSQPHTHNAGCNCGSDKTCPLRHAVIPHAPCQSMSNPASLIATTNALLVIQCTRKKSTLD